LTFLVSFSCVTVRSSELFRTCVPLLRELVMLAKTKGCCERPAFFNWCVLLPQSPWSGVVGFYVTAMTYSVRESLKLCLFVLTPHAVFRSCRIHVLTRPTRLLDPPSCRLSFSLRRFLLFGVFCSRAFSSYNSFSETSSHRASSSRSCLQDSLVFCSLWLR